jgi:hypothetical protein
MTEVDRSNLLHDLDRRHAAVLSELEQLDRRIEVVLKTARPAAAVGPLLEGVTAVGRAGPTC